MNPLFQCTGHTLKIPDIVDSKGIYITDSKGKHFARHLSGHSKSMTLHDSYLGAYSSLSDWSSGWWHFD